MTAAQRVVILIQENHTVDNYFGGLAPWGANVATGWPVLQNPPPKPPFSASYPPHNRQAYFEWLTSGKAEHSQVDTATVLPYYLHLAVSYAFLENHCAGFGTDSTANHMLLVGGQSPTLRNPASGTAPEWDLPSVPGSAGDHGLTWRCYSDDGYPVSFYTQLKASPSVVPLSHLSSDAAAGALPQLMYIWHRSGLDEHPPSDVTAGMNAVWQAVDTIVNAGGWDDTVFMLTWDDWGGFDDHVATPAVEYTPDNVQVAYGARVPLLMFGGRVKPGIDSRWCSHISIPKTALQLLDLPPLGVPRLDDDAGLADLVDTSRQANPQPPAYGTALAPLTPPSPRPAPRPLPPQPSGRPQPVGPVIRRSGAALPPPNDAPLPKQPAPPQ
ncbi:MAG: hypothetical protein JOY68_01630 [Candidatus Dormibacteraeota bacterium]|nr:hypothetical protein [Candidatus Dormibacteraeota bacterium]